MSLYHWLANYNQPGVDNYQLIQGERNNKRAKVFFEGGQSCKTVIYAKCITHNDAKCTPQWLFQKNQHRLETGTTMR